MVWEVVCGRYVTPHSNPCRLKQTSEWSAQAFHEGSLCGAMSHCTCSAEVWSFVLITNPSPHTHVSCFIFHVHHIITTHPLYPPLIPLWQFSVALSPYVDGSSGVSLEWFPDPHQSRPTYLGVVCGQSSAGLSLRTHTTCPCRAHAGGVCG